MAHPASAQIEEGVIEVLKNVSRRPIEPSLGSDLVADLGFDSLQVLETVPDAQPFVPPDAEQFAQMIEAMNQMQRGEPTGAAT